MLKGAGLCEKFKTVLPEFQVFDLSNGGPEPGFLFLKSLDQSILMTYNAIRLTQWKDSGYFRILVCGGDGTAGK